MYGATSHAPQRLSQLFQGDCVFFLDPYSNAQTSPAPNLTSPISHHYALLFRKGQIHALRTGAVWHRASPCEYRDQDEVRVLRADSTSEAQLLQTVLAREEFNPRCLERVDVLAHSAQRCGR